MIREAKTILGSDKIEIIFIGNSGKADGPFKVYKFADSAGIKNKVLSPSPSTPIQIENYFKRTESLANEIVSSYGAEEQGVGNYYGASALDELASLSGELGLQKTQQDNLRALDDKYSGTYLAGEAESSLEGARRRKPRGD